MTTSARESCDRGARELLGAGDMLAPHASTSEKAQRLGAICLLAFTFAAGGQKAQAAEPEPAKTEAAKTEAAKTEVAKPEAAKPESAKPSVSAPTSLAQAPAAGANLDDCASCHRGLTDGRKAHLPLQTLGCTECHKPADASAAPGKCKSPKASAWQLTAADEPALCARCHDTSKAHGVPHDKVHRSPLQVWGAGPWHPVIKSSGCTACHDPHASNNPALAKIWPVDALCAKCHAKYDDAAFIHTAVKKGDCLGCHSPHASVDKPLLLAKRDELCFACHKPETLGSGHVKHPPVLAGKCLFCHDPHESDVKDHLVESGKKLCLKCHDASAKAGDASPSIAFRIDLSKKHVHKPVASGDCQDCHTQGHSGDNAHLLLKPLAETCFKCHTKFDDLYKVQHEPARLGQCAACHDPHSSDNKGLLRFAKVNDLCASCHKDTFTGKAWVHKPIGEKGCTACHDAHGGDDKMALTDSVGALCASCHKAVGTDVKVKHKAMEQGCIACHEPHAGDQPHGLRKPVNELCLSCHAAQADPAHQGNMRLAPDASGQPVSCTRCHQPHGSDAAHLLPSVEKVRGARRAKSTH